MIGFDEAARATGGRWLAEPAPEAAPLSGGAFDTRNLGTAEIFFALAGEGGDGHDYLPRLENSSVRLAVVSREAPLGAWRGAVLLVEDTLAALAALAGFMARKYNPRVVAITGSYGKTTTKEVVAHVLSGGLRVLKSEGSLNNEIGVPITLLGLNDSHQVAVLEYSARKPGDIAYLCRIAPPDIAVLLTVGHAHIGVFGSREAIYRTKGEIFSAVKPGGLCLAGAHDPRLVELAGGSRVSSFGRDSGDYRAAGIHYDEQGRQCFTGINGETTLALQAGMPGPHGCEPVLVAWAVARELGLDDELVAARGAMHPEQKGRAVLSRTANGAVLIDDCYNASPETVVNLLGILASRPEAGKVLVLGPLAELEEGLDQSAAIIAGHLHPPLTRCLVYQPGGGPLGRRMAELSPGVVPSTVETPEQLLEQLAPLDAPGNVIGIKGARSAHMERFVALLEGRSVKCRKHPCGLLKYCTVCEML
ncbi:MAG: UDP-N-acetylmuramoyl-tripeptide--D-alanyl-D-alanine ligase [Deltaproteobacteria bacterium]|nr:UDP-N-acetylmuramoyl-tripeptide--D-alanyl-D-alanine ligase [Deltaproteobacteria bacterium]